MFSVLTAPTAFARGGFGGGSTAFAGPANGEPPTWHTLHIRGDLAAQAKESVGAVLQPAGMEQGQKALEQSPLGVPPGLYMHSLR